MGGLIGVGLALGGLVPPNVQVVFPEDGEQQPGPPPQQVPPIVETPTATASASATLTPTATATLEPTFTTTPALGMPLAEDVQNANLQQNLCVMPCPDKAQPGGACTP